MNDREKIFDDIINEKIPRGLVEAIITELGKADKDLLFEVLIEYENYLINNSKYYHELVYGSVHNEKHYIVYLPVYYGFFISSFDSSYISNEPLNSYTIEPIYRIDEFTNTILCINKSLTESIKYLIGEDSFWENKVSNIDNCRNDLNRDDEILIEKNYVSNDELNYYSKLPLFKKSCRLLWYNYPPIIDGKYFKITFSLKKHLNFLRDLYFSFKYLDTNIISNQSKNVFLYKIYVDITLKDIPNIFNKRYEVVLDKVSKMNRVEYDDYKNTSLLKDVYKINCKNNFKDDGYYYHEPGDYISAFEVPDYFDEEDLALVRGKYFYGTKLDRFLASHAFLFHKRLFQLIKYEEAPFREKIKKYQGENYFKTAFHYYKGGLKLKDVYKKIENEMSELGLEKRYINFASFKRAYYDPKWKTKSNN